MSDQTGSLHETESDVRWHVRRLINATMGALALITFQSETPRESARGICPPKGTTIEQLDDLVKNYKGVEDSSQKLSKDELAIQAMRKAWPCRRIA